MQNTEIIGCKFCGESRLVNANNYFRWQCGTREQIKMNKHYRDFHCGRNTLRSFNCYEKQISKLEKKIQEYENENT